MTAGTEPSGEVEPTAPRYALVAVAVPVHRGFHYRVPDSLLDRVQVGDRVRIRFHGRAMTGTVIRLDATASVSRVLDLEDCLGPEARMPEATIRLCEWVAERFGASLGESLDAALPPPLRRGGRARQVVRIRLRVSAAEVESRVAELDGRHPKQARALRILAAEGGDVTERELRQLAHISASPVHSLARGGLVERYHAEAEVDALSMVAPDAKPRPELTGDQARAVAALVGALREGRPRGFLLFGVTGSGKTEVYLRALEETVRLGRQGIALVPEISLTPQTVARFRGRFPRIAVLHSALTEAERMRQWRRIRRGEVDVVVGARSAVFAPLPDLGLIVVDEEHEPSFKQQNPPRYHARDVALHRARLENAVAILGSATPSLESWTASEDGKLTRLMLPERVGGGVLPEVQVVDLAHLPFKKRPQLLTDRLREALRQTLRRREQAILFLNRRGHSRVVLCPDCREPIGCKECDVSLVLHRGASRLICHLCGHEQGVPRECPNCRGSLLRFLGFGTERVEEELRRVLPSARIARMDSDTTGTRGSHERILAAFGGGEIDVLVGTQMIAKGLDFPKVTLVGIVSADTSLAVPDYRAAERTFQLVSQVAGRAGRSDRGGFVLVQTLQPDHFAIRAAVDHDYETFMHQELKERQATGYPPFGELMRVLVSQLDEGRVRDTAVKVADRLRPCVEEWEGQVLGPAPCPIARVRRMYRYQILVKCPWPDRLPAIIRFAQQSVVAAKPVRVTLDVDPASLL